MNYSIQEYANDAISALVDVCENGIKQPNIITESGRSLTAHHSVLVIQVMETTSLPAWKDSEEIDPPTPTSWPARCMTSGTASTPPPAGELARRPPDTRGDPRPIQPRHAGPAHPRPDRKAVLEHSPRGGADGRRAKHAPLELRKVARITPDKYFCNFSLFQSLTDSWAIDQIFPIMPISRLDERTLAHLQPSRT